jgi:hypothetical protein
MTDRSVDSRKRILDIVKVLVNVTTPATLIAPTNRYRRILELLSATF